MPAVTFITDLPDATGLEIDASVEDELTATWDAVLNNGDYRLEYREDDPDAEYAHVATLAWDADELSHTIKRLAGDTAYSVRLRTETDYKTGEWTTATETTPRRSVQWAPTGGLPNPITGGGSMPASAGQATDATGTPALQTAPTGGLPNPITGGGSMPGVAGTGTTGAVPAVADEYQLVLERAADESAVGQDDVRAASPLSIDTTREHSAISDWEVAVPYDLSFEDWAEDFADARIEFDGKLVFRGTLEIADSSDTDLITTLSGRGPGRDLTRGEIALTFAEIRADEAIREVWDEHTGFAATVETPPNPRTIQELDVEGTPIDVLQELHEFAGMHFAVEQDVPGLSARSFAPGEVILEGGWESLGTNRGVDVTDYANRVVVRGARFGDGSGERYRGEASDAVAIERDGREITYPILDPGLESPGDCESEAEEALSDLLDARTVDGSIDVTPTMITPGYAYTVDEWDDERRVGPHALQFAGGDVSLPTAVLDPLTNAADGNGAGTISMWVKADWSRLPGDNARLIGSRSMYGAGAELRTIDSTSLTLRVPSNYAAENGDGEGRGFGTGGFGTGGFGSGDATAAGTASVDAYPRERPPDGEWTLVHYGWDYDRGVDETALYAGHDGAWLDMSVLPGRVLAPDRDLWIGRYLNDRFSGTIDDARFWDDRLSVGMLTRLADRVAIETTTLRHRYRFDAGPESGARVTDAVGGLHGERTTETTAYSGSPVVLESVDYQESPGEMGSTLDFTSGETLYERLGRVEREIEQTKQTI